MKLKLKQQLLVGFMLFSLFFGAGNLIFPPFLGNQSGKNMPLALVGFLITAVILPVLGVIIVSKFNGLDKLASKVNSKFAIVFTVIILLSIGPGLGIPRAASVPFEMAISPYLKEGLNPKLFMLLYSFIFFALALWLAFTPSKLLKRIGYVLTPSLLILLVVLFITFFVKGQVQVADPHAAYTDTAFLTGFCDGYLTMDTIAALNFGLVISGTLYRMGVKDPKKSVCYTIKTGLIAGLVLALIYLGLSYIGMSTSSANPSVENGAEILRNVVYDLFGNGGAFILAAIFTLACLTTCVGLITSISEYFSHLFKGCKYNVVVIVVTVFSFIICNMGLNTILSISVPVLNAIYPVSIVLILLGMFDGLYKDNKIIYPLTVAATAVISLIYTVYDMKVPMGAFGKWMEYIPAFKLGFGWVIFAAVAVIISLIIHGCMKAKTKKAVNK